MQTYKELLKTPLGLFRHTVENTWNGDAVCIVLKFYSTEDYNNAYRFFKSTFDPRCFNTGGTLQPELVLNRRGIEELAELWSLKTEDIKTKTLEISIPSRMEAVIQYLLQ